MTSREPRWTRSPRALAAGVGLVLLLGVALPGVPAGAEKSAPALYQWTDSSGNVRYTPDPDRVPSSQRGTLLRLEPGMPPANAPQRPGALPGQAPAPSAVVSPAATAPNAAPVPVAAPTPASASTPAPAGAANATPRGEAPSAPVSPPAAAAGDAAREQQLAAAIAADQAALEALISAPVADGDATLADSAQLREIARRLPGLQAELSALRERRAPRAGP